MERFDIRMLTSAFSKRYTDSRRGSWMPLLGQWDAENDWQPTNTLLHDGGDGEINPAPLVAVVGDKIRDYDLTVEITYKIAKFKEFEFRQYTYRKYAYPVYEYDETKVYTFTIPKFSDINTIIRIAPSDNLIYDIVDVQVTSSHRFNEMFQIYALASPTARIIYGMKWYELYENAVLIKNGLWAAPPWCVTCVGTGIYQGSTCPECEGFKFSGVHAINFILDRKGKDTNLTRFDGEDDQQFGKRIWTRKWWVIPTEDEIKRYFMHFCHIDEADEEEAILIYKIEDLDEPTFYVCINPEFMGSKALWQMGDAFEDYDSVVEKIPPAGVNAYFSWLMTMFDDVPGDGVGHRDDSSSQFWQFIVDVYGAAWNSAVWYENQFGEGRDELLQNFSGIYSAWENFKSTSPGSPPSGWVNSFGAPEVIGSFLGHNHALWLKDQGDLGSTTFTVKSLGTTLAGTFYVDAYVCMLEELQVDNSGVGAGVINAGSTGYISIGFAKLAGNPSFLQVSTQTTTVQALTPAQTETNKWYHVHLECDLSGDTVDIYVDGVFSQTISSANIANDLTLAFVSTLSIPGPDVGYMVDALDGSWDSNYWSTQNGSTCKTRNMFQETLAVHFKPSLYGGVVPPSCAGNHWIKGLTQVTKDNFKWYPQFADHELVMVSPNFSFSLGSLPKRVEYWYDGSDGEDVVPAFTEDFTYSNGTKPNQFNPPWTYFVSSESTFNRIYINGNRMEITDRVTGQNVRTISPQMPSLAAGKFSFKFDTYQQSAIASPTIPWNWILYNVSGTALVTMSWYMDNTNNWRLVFKTADSGYVFTVGVEYDVDVWWSNNKVWVKVGTTLVVNGLTFDTNGSVVSMGFQTASNNDFSGEWFVDDFVASVPRFVHRVVNCGENIRYVFDNGKLVSKTLTSATTYTINHDYVSGIVMEDFDFINSAGGVIFPSSRTQREVPSEWTLHGIYIQPVDEWKGVALPCCIASNGNAPQYIVDTETIGNADSSWECYLYLDPNYDSEFRIEFYTASGLAFNLRFDKGNVLNNAGTILGGFGNRKWTHIKVEWDLTAYTFDTYVDDQLVASGTAFANNYKPFTYLRIGWIVPGTYNVGDVAYIAGIRAGETDLVDETIEEVVTEDPTKLVENMFGDDFEGDLSKWTITHSNATYPRIQGGYLELKWVSPSQARLYFDLPSPITVSSGSDYIKWEFRSPDAQNSSCTMFLRSGTTVLATLEHGFSSQWRLNGSLVKATTQNIWETIEFKNFNFGAQTFDFYIDGSPEATGVSFQASVSDIDNVLYQQTVGILAQFDDLDILANTTDQRFNHMPVQSARMQKVTNYEYEPNAVYYAPSYVKAFERENQAILTLLGQDRHLESDASTAWVGDKMRLFIRSWIPYRDGTFNFREDVINGHPRGWEINEQSNTFIDMIDNIGNHEKVVQFYDNNPAGAARMANYFGKRIDGEIELYMRRSDATKMFYISIRDATGTEGLKLYMHTSGAWLYNAAQAFDGSPAANADTWYHVRIYLDTATDTANIWINGTQLLVGASPSIPFANLLADISQVHIYTDTPASNYYCYVDAVGFSWDPFYQIGTNKSLMLDEATKYWLRQPRWVGSSVLWTRKPLDFVNHRRRLHDVYRFRATYDLDWSSWTLTSATVEIAKDDHIQPVKIVSGGDMTISGLSQTTGTVEFWMQTDSTGTDPFRMSLDGGPVVETTAGLLAYFDGSAKGFHDINGNTITVAGRGWVHIKMEFDCGTDTFKCWLDGELLWDNTDSTTNIPFASVKTSITSITADSFADDCHVDAIGFSWDSGYTIGDNIYPTEENDRRMLGASYDTIGIDKVKGPLSIRDADRIMVISKGLNKLYTN
jgi:hypothetical protein